MLDLPVFFFTYLQVGAARLMIRISELRAIDIPFLDIEDMQRIGEEYALSCEKRSILAEMIDIEGVWRLKDITSYLCFTERKEAGEVDIPAKKNPKG